MKKNLFSTLVFVICCLASTSVLAETYEIRASTKDYNRLVFPVPYDSIVIPHESKLAEEPVPLADHKSILVRPRPGSPIPIFVQLQNGESFTVKLIPGTASEGAVFRYKDAQDFSDMPEYEHRPNDEWISAAVIAGYQGTVPMGFAIDQPGQPALLRVQGDERTNIILVPVSRYRGSGHYLSVYQVQSDVLINIEPRDFYRKGIVAASLEGDIVGPSHHPRLVVLEVDDARKK